MLNDPISQAALHKNTMPGHLFEGNPVDEDTKRRVTDTPMQLSQSLLFNRIPRLFEYTLREPWEALVLIDNCVRAVN